MSNRQQLLPEEIQARSFEIIAGLLPEYDQSSPTWPIIRRIVHTTGDPSIAALLRIHPGAVTAGVGALRAGRPIITDVKMLASGINRKLSSSLGCEIHCVIDAPGTQTLASERGLTRSAAAMMGLSTMIPGSIVAIGNAPTALFTLLDLIAEGVEPPALVIGTPVGFVGAAESKQELVEFSSIELPYVTVEGTRGGSAIAVATINALLIQAVEAAGSEPVRAT